MREYPNEWADIKYRMPTAFEQLSGLWPIRMGRNQAKISYWVGPKAIECYSMHLVLNGRLRLISPETEFSLEAGDLFCLYPGITYEYGLATFSASERNDAASPLQLAWLAFNGPMAPALLLEAGISEQRPVRGGAAASLLAEWEALFEQLGKAEDMGHILGLQSLLHALFQRLFASAAIGSTADGPDAHRQDRKLAAAKAYFDLHFREAISIQDAARHVKLHRSYFTKRFMEQFGLSPRDYLQQLRMEEARTLLQRTSRPVTDIGLSVGYQDLYTFTRAFAREHGVSPSAFRLRGTP